MVLSSGRIESFDEREFSKVAVVGDNNGFGCQRDARQMRVHRHIVSQLEFGHLRGKRDVMRSLRRVNQHVRLAEQTGDHPTGIGNSHRRVENLAVRADSDKRKYHAFGQQNRLVIVNRSS